MMGKKIGILTLPFNNNYGGYLQAFALMKIIKGLGHEVVLINRRHNRRAIKWRFFQTLKNFIKFIMGRKVLSIVPNQQKELWIEGERMMPFVEKYIIPQTRPIYNSHDLYQQIKLNKFDVIVVGSDQIWRPDYVPNVEDYFLPSLDSDPIKVAYAASFGTEMPEYSIDQVKICGKGYARFDAVSLRERDGVKIIKENGWISKNEPVVVLDPTLLLTKDDYNILIDGIDMPFAHQTFCYVLDNSVLIEDVISTVDSYLQCKHFDLNDLRKESSKPSIEQWLACFRNADFVITDSFHGTVFCIIYNKPFVVCSNKARGKSRLTNLLQTFGLEDHMISRPSDLSYDKMGGFNWEQVNRILYTERQKSLLFLSKHL